MSDPSPPEGQASPLAYALALVLGIAPLVMGPLEGDDGGGGVLADGRAARALPLRIVEEETNAARDHPASGRHADGDLVGFGALADDRVGANELDTAGPKLRRTRLAHGLEGGCHA